jgi:hypothetical protein
VTVADLMRGTGRFNVAQGAVMTAQNIGAALSTTLAGLIVVNAGYSGAALCLFVTAGDADQFRFPGGRHGADSAADFRYRSRIVRRIGEQCADNFA